VAAAVRTPTVAVFGPSSVPIWRPTGERTQVIEFGEHDVAAARRAVEELL
jgi:ADP-heptose:LPS heptosyltransferase